jgi:Kef-type K+ transport system membrane component KefB
MSSVVVVEKPVVIAPSPAMVTPSEAKSTACLLGLAILLTATAAVLILVYSDDTDMPERIPWIEIVLLVTALASATPALMHFFRTMKNVKKRHGYTLIAFIIFQLLSVLLLVFTILHFSTPYELFLTDGVLLLLMSLFTCICIYQCLQDMKVAQQHYDKLFKVKTK